MTPLDGHCGQSTPLDVDLKKIPHDYLETYPFPAFVLPVACSLLNDSDLHLRSGEPASYLVDPILLPLRAVWQNQHWKRVSGGRSLQDCISPQTASRIRNWIARSLSVNQSDNEPQRPQRAPIRRNKTWNGDNGGSPAGLANQRRMSGLDSRTICESLDDNGCGTLTIACTLAKGTAFLELILAPLQDRVGKQLPGTAAASHVVITTVPRSNKKLFAIPSPASTRPAKLESSLEVPVAENEGISKLVPYLGINDGLHKNGIPEDELPNTLFNGVKVLKNWNPDMAVNVAPDDKPSVDMRSIIFARDWSTTPLGPIEMWPDNLVTILGLCMGLALPNCFWWGRDLTMIYNYRFAEYIPGHPAKYGASREEAWAVMERMLGGDPKTFLSGGQPTYRFDELHFVEDRNTGRVVETYRSSMWSTAVGHWGEFNAIWCTIRDSSDQVVSGRRTSLLRDLYDGTLSAKTLHEFEKGVLETLHGNPKEAPFGMLYHADRAPRATGGSAQRAGTVQLRYAGGVGVPLSHPSAPEAINVDMSKKDVWSPPERRNAESGPSTPDTINPRTLAPGTVTPRPESPAFCNTTWRTSSANRTPWPFAEAMRTCRPVVVPDCSVIIEGYSIRQWDELPTSAVVIPIGGSPGFELPSAVLILGLSCRLTYNDGYVKFIEDIKTQLSVYLARVLTYMADQQRIDHLADIDRDKSTLLLNIVHQLVAPLALIHGPLDDMIADRGHRSETSKELTNIRVQVRRLKRLVEMLNDISHLEADRLRGAFKKENLGLVTGGIASFFTKVASKGGNTYSYKCDQTPRDIYIHRELWEKMLFILIGGGIQMGKKKVIELTLEYTDTEALIIIGDNGDLFIPGKQRVGERYRNRMVHVHDVLQASVAIMFTSKIVRLHGGTFKMLTLGSDVEPQHYGTTFELRLPLGTAHLALDMLGETPTATASEPTAAGLEFSHEILDDMDTWARRPPPIGSAASATDDGSSSYESNPSKRGIDVSTLYFKKEDVIMIVDDMPDNRRYIRSMFDPFCTIVEATDGQDALDKYHILPPDLVIGDIMIPRMDGLKLDNQRVFNGLELLFELRHGTKAQRMVPFIMITGVDELDLIGGLRADDTVLKPYNSKDLVARAHMQMQLGKKRQALEQLFEERTVELRVLTENSPVAIFRCDNTGAITYANQCWYEFSGFPHLVEEGRDMNWIPYLAGDHQTLGEEWKQWIETDLPGIEIEVQWKSGRWCSAKILRLDKVAPGVKPGFLGCMVDVTERKLNEELQRQRIADAEQRRAEAEEARRQQELLIDITSHEIRNPISSLMQCASLVKTNLLAQKEQLELAIEQARPFVPTRQLLVTLEEDLEALDSIYQCGLVQERISNDVLSLSKIQLDLLQVIDVETDILNEARKTIAIFQNEARMNRIQLKLIISDTFQKFGLETVMTDPARLGQVVSNLLSNATKFTSSSAVRRIELRLDVGFEHPPPGSCVKPVQTLPLPEIKEGMPAFIFMSVSDTGPGLTEQELEHLFERFTQASPMTHTVFGGSGLGLFVCRKIVLRMGGAIEVASEYGKGSQFRFFIEGKVGKVSPPAKPNDGSKTCGPSVPKVKTKGRDGKAEEKANGKLSSKPKILVVEDNLINRTVLLRQLKHVGLATDSATNGLEGVNKIRAAMKVDGSGSPYGCVLMDLEMPVMDGYTAVRNVRQEEDRGELNHSVIIALTGNARQAQIEEHMADFDDVVVKPYRLDDLLHKIEEVLQRKKPRRATK